MNHIHFQWFGELFKHTWLDFQMHLSWHTHETPPCNKTIGFHTFVCDKKIDLKTTSKLKIKNFEYLKKITTLKRCNMKR
jgi:hypothetical protein